MMAFKQKSGKNRLKDGSGKAVLRAKILIAEFNFSQFNTNFKIKSQTKINRNLGLSKVLNY